MDETEIKDLAISLVLDQYKPATEEDTTGHMTIDDFMQILETSVIIEKNQLSAELVAND